MVITGGTKGIGKAILHRFLAEDFTIFTCGSTEASVAALHAEMNSKRVIVNQVDVANKAAVQQWAREVMGQTQNIDVLINNAGRVIPGAIGEEPEGAFEEMMATNLASAYHCTRAFLPTMKASKKGHIFNICSTASVVAYPNGGSYCISKFGLLGMSKVLREELKPFGIKVTSVLPGATFTESWAATSLPQDRFIPVEDIARLVWAAYNAGPSSVVEELLVRPLLGDIG